MAAIWKVLAAAMLLHSLPSCIPVAGADPLIITVARDGSDEVACLKGQIACNTFQYACLVDGNGGDVTMVITYSQVLLYDQLTKIGLDIRNLKLIGEAEDGYTFICSGLTGGLSIQGSPIKQIWLENIRLLCVGELSILDIDSVYLKGYVGQGLSTGAVTVNIEDSTFVYVSGYKSIIYIPTMAGTSVFNVSVTLKNSSVIHKNKTGNPLSVHVDVDWGVNFDIFIENTNFTLTQPPSPDQPAAMQVNIHPIHNPFSNQAVSMNFTISKCNFFNYNSTGLEVVMEDGTAVEEMYLSIVGSQFFVPWDSYYGPIMSSSGISVTQGWGEDWGGRANVHTRIEGNTFRPIN